MDHPEQISAMLICPTYPWESTSFKKFILRKFISTFIQILPPLLLTIKKPIWVFLLNLTKKIKQKLKEGLLYREEIGSWHRQWDWLCPLHQAGHRWLSKKERRKNKKERNGKGLGLSLTVMRWAGVLRFRLPLPGPSVCYVSPSDDFFCPGKLWWVDKSSQVWTVWQRRKLWKIYFMETDVVYFQFSTFCH